MKNIKYKNNTKILTNSKIKYKNNLREYIHNVFNYYFCFLSHYFYNLIYREYIMLVGYCYFIDVFIGYNCL